MDSITERIEGIPGFSIIQDKWNDFAGSKYNCKDPFFDESTHKRLRVPEGATEEEKATWKKVQSAAWNHDKCFCGCMAIGTCCCGCEGIGIGSAPIAAIIPVIGPVAMYAVHERVCSEAEKGLNIPLKLQAQMHANSLFDLAVSLVPILGILFSWMNSCSTRNARLIYTYLYQTIESRNRQNHSGRITGMSVVDPPAYPPRNNNHYNPNAHQSV
ncbi:hypothetical protein CANCADRAFT_132314 [Tortispora caseinolytica NRRL Y-17796]|uniref:Uncharacterized protein n=1 Tax=Tortispora caseinolytica NRRL Y-17796 TaxID=767744 RepID=A0A1E4TB04_9ASCO|nr:hypothetical protein CANCADRAFT_132314 [Tortispora caseinolytica NRRL Y-17796]